jgi:hypothetical protein
MILGKTFTISPADDVFARVAAFRNSILVVNTFCRFWTVIVYLAFNSFLAANGIRIAHCVCLFAEAGK